MRKPLHLTVYVDFDKASEEMSRVLTTLQNDIFQKFKEFLATQNYTLTPPKKDLSGYRVIGWLLPKERLRAFYEALRQSAFIRCSYKVFEQHFLSIDFVPPKIRWYGNANALSYLFTLELTTKKIIPFTKAPFKLISNHFCKPNGDDFKNDLLRKNHFKGIGNRDSLDAISKIIKPLKAVA